MNWFATFVCSLYWSQWTHRAATLTAFIVWAAFWRSRTSALWTASGCSYISAVPPACWSGTCWTSWRLCAHTVRSASRRCSAVNCSLTCTTGKTQWDADCGYCLTFTVLTHMKLKLLWVSYDDIIRSAIVLPSFPSFWTICLLQTKVVVYDGVYVMCPMLYSCSSLMPSCVNYQRPNSSAMWLSQELLNFFRNICFLAF